MIRILVDSSSDYEIEEVKRKNLELIPINVTLNGKSYADGIELKKDTFFKMLVESDDFPQTAQPSPETFLNIFEDAKSKGDQIICILLSSGLSGTYQSALLVKNMIDYEGIYIVDSLTATYPIKIMADYACSLVKEGLSAPQIVEKLENIKSRVRLLAVLDTLEYLSKGGRIPKSIAAIGEIAKVKPVITVTKDGQVGVLAKCLGKKKASSHIIKTLSEIEIDTTFPVSTIYSYGTDNCEVFEQKLTQSGYNIKERAQIGSTIGAHIGPGAFGVVFVEKA